LVFFPENLTLQIVSLLTVFLAAIGYCRSFLFFTFFFFFAVLGFELRAYTLSHSSSPFW
jgi:hypothetical protein